MRWFQLLLLCVSNILLLALAGVSSAQTSSSQTTSGSTSSEQTTTVTTIRETDTKVVQQQVNGTITAAIFVKNRADGVPDSKVDVLDDLITAQLTDKGFRIISREDLLNAVSGFAGAGANKGDPSLAGADLDKVMSNNTSAVRLAQSMSANYILVVAIDTYGSDQIQYDEGDIHTQITDTKMTLTYKLLDSASGGSLSAGEVTASRKDRVQPGLQISRDMVDNLLKDAAVKLSAVLADKAAAGQVAAAGAPSSATAQFTIVCTMSDLNVPITTKNDAGDYVVTANATIQIPATVEVDGIAVGTTPGPLQSAPGIHKVRISAAGFRDWNYTSNLYQGEQLNVALQLDTEGYARWGDSAAFLEGLKDKAKLTNAEADKIEGLAQMFRQSGYKVDIKKNININGAPPSTVIETIPVMPVMPVAPVYVTPTTQPMH
jgi:PEGA domain